jgi:hypothetical protein
MPSINARQFPAADIVTRPLVFDDVSARVDRLDARGRLSPRRTQMV